MAIISRNGETSGDPHQPVIRFREQEFVPLLSGALFWPKQNTLLVADLHFEKMSSFARTGQLLPPYDTGATLSRLEQDLQLTGAARVICLGDSFHRQKGAGTLLPGDQKRLSGIVGQRQWVWLAGNHDPAPHALGGECLAGQSRCGLTLLHEPSTDISGQIAGHLHPAARVRINGRSLRRPCFVYDERLMILPAYGVSTGSLNILSPAFDGLLRPRNMHIIMLGKNRLYPVSSRRLVL